MLGRGNSAILDLLSRTVGPAPWYWKTFPSIDVCGQRYVWRCEDAAREAPYPVVLHAPGDVRSVVLGIGMYSRVFALPPNLLGIWFEEPAFLRVVAIDPDDLQPFDAADTSSAAAGKRPFCCTCAPLGEFRVELNLERGDHRIDLPLAFAGLDHLLLIGSYARVQEAACAAVFEIRPGAASGSRRVCVFPQKWFDRDTFDLGYQWITRVAREPANGRIVGDGIRLPGAFVTNEDGCRLDRWIESG